MVNAEDHERRQALGLARNAAQQAARMEPKRIALRPDIAVLCLAAGALLAGLAGGAWAFRLGALRDDVAEAHTRLEAMNGEIAKAQTALAQLRESGASAAFIDCTDATGRRRKCVRIDPDAGEMRDEASKAVFRAIHGL